jgi:DNA-binding LytR/AlgR family response regulator
MKIVILEDNKIELEEIKKTINIWSFDQDIHTTISAYSSGEEYFHQNQSFDYDTDLFLLDIEMGDINGITVAEKLRSMAYRGYIIFLTANREYVFEGYNVHAFHFLTKPLNKELFFKCLTEIQNRKGPECYILHDKSDSIPICYSDIICFSSDRHYTTITTLDETHTERTDLNKIINKLPKQFVQIHRSHIINLDCLVSFKNGEVHLRNNIIIPVGRSYLDDFKIKYLRYVTRFERNEEKTNGDTCKKNHKSNRTLV